MTAKGTARGAYRHCGLDPQSRGEDGRLSLSASLTVILAPIPSFPRRRESTGRRDAEVVRIRIYRIK